MAEFEVLLSNINGHAARNLERINEIGGSLQIGGWIAKWGSWQIFKHDISAKCNVVRGVAVSVDDETPQCRYEKSTACIFQISGGSCVEIDGEERTISAQEILSVGPGTRFAVSPVTAGSEFIMILIPPAPAFDVLMNASSLKDLLGVCEDGRDGS